MNLRRIALCLALSCFAPQLAHAQAPSPAARVGRVSFVSGGVSVQPAGVNVWTPAALNRVVSDGDHVFAGDRARAELHMGHLVVRLDGNTVLEVQQLTAHGARLALLQGRINVVLVGGGAPDSLYEVDMPTAATNLQGRGTYTLRAAPDGTVSSLTVRRGSAELFVDGTATPVMPDMTAGARDRQPPHLRTAGPSDAFDGWSSERQRRDDAAVALRYLRSDIVGFEDLDTYGTWRQSKDDGPLWQPNDTPEGWAPYHDGQWSYTRTWGWTWNDEAPWGFAPSHYGRWVNVDGAWAWAPGKAALAGADPSTDPVYAPATVAFLQIEAADEALAAKVAGAEVGEMLSAWVPLAPSEPLMASYGGYYRAPKVKVSEAQLSHGGPAYASRPGAVVLGGREAFRNAVPVHYRQTLTPEAAAQLRPVSGGRVATPTLASVVAPPPHAPARVAQPPRDSLSRMVVAHAPQPARPARLVPPPPTTLQRDRNADDPSPTLRHERNAADAPPTAGGRVAPVSSRVRSETIPLHGERPVNALPSTPRRR